VLMLDFFMYILSPSAIFYGFWFFEDVGGQVVLMLNVNAYFLWVLVS
jgi:hypothetical protein